MTNGHVPLAVIPLLLAKLRNWLLENRSIVAGLRGRLVGKARRGMQKGETKGRGWVDSIRVAAIGFRQRR